MMIRIKLILLFLTCLHFSNKAQSEYSIPDSVERIVFLGNSITYSGTYVSYIEAYLRVKYPERQIEIINMGLPSETVSGLSELNHASGKFPRPDLRERLKRILEQLKPDLVFASYGMNDGIYLPFDDSRFNKYKEGINWLNSKVTAFGSEIIFITPPVYDERQGPAYANLLDIYSDWLISKRYTSDWKVIDIHWPMKKYLEDRRLIDSTFQYAKDGIHPNKLGHWVMAKNILLFLGESQVTALEDAETGFSHFKNGLKVLQLVTERQAIIRDAWLSSIGHKRPNLKIGLPLNEAKRKAKTLDSEIHKLLE